MPEVFIGSFKHDRIYYRKTLARIYPSNFDVPYIAQQTQSSN